MVLLQGATPAQLGPVVRALSPAPPWRTDASVLHVCLGAPELASAPAGARVLLRVRPQDVAWLNVHRPLVSERALRLVLWADDAATDALLREAIDFSDWVSRMVAVPTVVAPAFAIDGVRAALAVGAPFSWRGPALEEVLAVVGVGGQAVEVPADAPLRALIAVFEGAGLPIVVGLDRERDVLHVKLALTRARRTSPWIARDPNLEIDGLWRLHAEPAGWDEATATLQGAGWRHPGLMAAWVDLEPERITAAKGRVGLPPDALESWTADEIAAARAPAYVLRARGGDEDVIAARQALAERITV